MKKIILFVLPLFIAGCASLSYYSPPGNESSIEEEGIKKAIKQKFDDIPVPEKMVLDAQNSFVFDNGEIRLANLKYSSRLSAEDVVAYFKKQLPLQGWELINMVEYGISRLSFAKEKESLEIAIYPERRGCKVILTLTPKATGL